MSPSDRGFMAGLAKSPNCPYDAGTLEAAEWLGGYAEALVVLSRLAQQRARLQWALALLVILISTISTWWLA